MKQKFSIFIGISAVSVFTFLAIATSTPGHKAAGYDQTATIPPNSRATDGPALPEQNAKYADMAMTARIRGEIAASKNLSSNARSVRVFTTGGRVVLKGLVVTAEEKRLIGDVAIGVSRRENVDNQLVVRPSPSAPSTPTGFSVVQ